MKNARSFNVILTICLGILSSNLTYAVTLTPGLSRVRTTSQLGTPLETLEDIDSQTGTTGPLAAGVVHSKNALTHDLDGLAVFSNPTAGTVNLSYIRSDSATFGTGIIFGGESLFRYQFNVDQPTTVVVDYDMLGTSNVNGNQVNPWYAMQGFRVTVNGQSNYVNWTLDAGPLPPWSNDPMPYAGTYLYNIPAGNSYLEISVAASSSGNQGQGTRTMEGVFDFQIGPAVPEPSSLTLIGLGALGLLCIARRRRA